MKRVLSATAVVLAGAMLVVGPMGTARASQGATVRDAARIVVSDGDPTPEEQTRLREVAGAIWTPELAAGWNMNGDVAGVLSQATGEILKCSEAFALVPRPPKFLPGLGYLVSYWKQLRDYYLVVKTDRTYRACVVATALNYRSAIEMASQGI